MTRTPVKLFFVIGCARMAAMAVLGREFLPMREKDIDERVGLWFIFGEHESGHVDIADGDGDVFVGLPKEIAQKLVLAQRRFREGLYRILSDNSA